MRELLAEGHNIGRVGGDEFVIVFRNTPIRTATAICRGIVDWIGATPYQIGDKAFQVRGSIGLIEVAAGTNVKDAMSAADRACREAKKGLHANLVVYEKNEAVFKEREEELRLIERLGTGVVPEGLFLVMQPIMSLREPYESLNFEILLRMRQADNSITSAGKNHFRGREQRAQRGDRSMGHVQCAGMARPALRQSRPDAVRVHKPERGVPE